MLEDRAGDGVARSLVLPDKRARRFGETRIEDALERIRVGRGFVTQDTGHDERVRPRAHGGGRRADVDSGRWISWDASPA